MEQWKCLQGRQKLKQIIQNKWWRGLPPIWINWGDIDEFFNRLLCRLEFWSFSTYTHMHTQTPYSCMYGVGFSLVFFLFCSINDALSIINTNHPLCICLKTHQNWFFLVTLFIPCQLHPIYLLMFVSLFFFFVLFWTNDRS